MALELFDTENTIDVEVAGTVVHIRQLVNHERLKILSALAALKIEPTDAEKDEVGDDKMKIDPAQMGVLFSIVGSAISSFEGIEGDPTDILNRIKDAKLQGEIVGAVLGSLSPNKELVGNSNCSSPGDTTSRLKRERHPASVKR